MARGSDVRARMITAGQELLSGRGYSITMLEVIERAKTPRGSIYYHFPHGKEELAIAAAEKTGGELEHLVAVYARRNPEPGAFVEALVDHHTKRLVTSRFSEGCPLLGITVSSDSDSPQLAGAVDDAFGKWVTAVAVALGEKGIAQEASEQLATTIVAAIEGAIVLARASKDRTPLARVRVMLPLLVRSVISESAPV